MIRTYKGFEYAEGIPSGYDIRNWKNKKLIDIDVFETSVKHFSTEELAKQYIDKRIIIKLRKKKLERLRVV